MLDVGECDPVHGCDLIGIRREERAALRPQHDRRDQISGTGRIIVEHAEHMLLVQGETEFFH